MIAAPTLPVMVVRAFLAFIVAAFFASSAPLFAQTASAQDLADLDTLQADLLITSPNLPTDSVANSDDITSLYYNPAGLGVHPLQIGYFYGLNDQDELQDHTVFLNLLGIAFSAQWRFAPKTLNARKYSVGTSLGNSRLFSVGTSYSWFDSNAPVLDDYKQWDVGFLLRPLRRISLGVVARALNKPVLGEEKFRPRWDLGLGIRPWWSEPERLTISVDTTWNLDDAPQDLLPRYSIEMVPISGVALYGGWDNYTNIHFGLKFSQNISQLSFQLTSPKEKGDFYSGGILFGEERFKTKGEAISSWLVLKLDERFAEEKREGSLFIDENLTFFEILQGIETAKTDSQINGILITGRHFSGGWGQAEELRRALLYFQNESNKPVVAFLEAAGNKEYYIASVARQISMPRAATLELNGLKAELTFLKGLLGKVGVEADFVKIGKYKSAPEAFTNDEPSKFAEEQTKAIMNNLNDEMVRAIMHSRKNLTREELEKLLNQGYFNSEKAKEAGLIDRVEYFSELKEHLTKDRISDIFWDKKLTEYVKTLFYDDSWGPRPAIAVIVMEGDIISGSSRPAGFFSGSSIGSDSIVEVLKNVGNMENVEGVVIRINSPGGSGLASDVIWNEIRRLTDKKKYVTISLGNVAASGGYYLAVGGNEIVANQNTITGSIGVFAGKFSLKGLYKLLGVNKKVYTTHDKSALFSETDKFSDTERAMLQEHLEEFYELFLNRVQRSRTGLNMQEIRENAQGRVYTGAEAKRKGMVDHVGGLMLALELTRIKAGIDKEHMDVLLYPHDARQILALGDPGRLALPAAVEKAIKLMSKSDRLKDDQIFFLLPYDIEIE